MKSMAHTTALAISFLFLFAQTDSSRQVVSETEIYLLDSVNYERVVNGLPRLRWDAALARAARKHAERMAEQNLLLHQLPDEPALATRARAVGASFSRIRENIASGQNADLFHDGWMGSPGHRANILDPDVDSVGIAVVLRECNEEFFGVEDFAQTVEALSVEAQEKQVATLLAARGLRLVNIGNDARNTCALDNGYVGKRRPRYVAHFETPDLSRLPEPLQRAIQNSRYVLAAVGACSPTPSSEFTLYRIAVLLY